MMSDTVKVIVYIIGFFIVVFATGLVLTKLEDARRRAAFRRMCFAAARVVCDKTDVSYRQIRDCIDYNIESCVKYKDRDCPVGIRECFRNNDYMRFAYISALEHVSWYDEEQEGRKRVEEFCSVYMPSVLAPDVKLVDYDNDDLSSSLMSNPYLLAFCLWVVLVPVAELIVTVVKLVGILLKTLF